MITVDRVLLALMVVLFIIAGGLILFEKTAPAIHPCALLNPPS